MIIPFNRAFYKKNKTLMTQSYTKILNTRNFNGKLQ